MSSHAPSGSNRRFPVSARAGATFLGLIAYVLSGCPSADSEPAFPADYASRYIEVRDCRRSPEHDLAFIRVFASPDAASVYRERSGTFADGAVLVKEEFADPACTMLEGFTVMARERGGWRWQEVTADRRVLQDGELRRCIGCHDRCEAGFQQTCAMP